MPVEEPIDYTIRDRLTRLETHRENDFLRIKELSDAVKGELRSINNRMDSVDSKLDEVNARLVENRGRDKVTGWLIDAGKLILAALVGAWGSSQIR